MIEVIENPDGKNLLKVNGELLESGVSLIRSRESDLRYLGLYIKNPNDVSLILDSNIADFPPIEYICFPCAVNWLNTGGHLRFWISDWGVEGENIERCFEISVEFDAGVVSWKAGYSLGEYYELFEKKIVEERHLSLQMNDPREGLQYGFLVSRRQLYLPVVPISFLVDDLLSEIKTIHQEIEAALIDTDSWNSINVSFAFPPEIRVYCEQYLTYFAKFLCDLGIDATSEIKIEAEKVLFAVTPVDQNEALDRIRAVLALYLNLPSSPIVYDESFASIRLQQQIDNLQHSQKMASREIQFTEKILIAQSATIQEKNLLISQKDIVIEQQNKIIEKITSKSIMMDSLENKEEFEKVFEGLEFGESKELKEKLGIKFNPITSLKTLGGKLKGKDSDITSLNLNEVAKGKD